MAGRPELAGDALDPATKLGFSIQKLPEREEGKGNSIPALAWPRRARAARSMAGGHGARRSSPKPTLATTKRNETRKRGKGIQTEERRAAALAAPAVPFCARMRGKTEARKGNGGEGTGLGHTGGFSN